MSLVLLKDLLLKVPDVVLAYLLLLRVSAIASVPGATGAPAVA